MQRGWVVSPEYRATIEAIRAVRMRSNISQRELARRLNKPPSFVNKIELLERRLDIWEFIQIARALDLKPEGLIAEIDRSLSPPAPANRKQV